MPSIIRQPSETAGLPDLRNLGTILRILLAVNGATLVAALAREPRLGMLATEWATLTGFVEPHLFAELALLWLVQPWLARVEFRTSVVIMTVITCVLGIGVHALTPRMANEVAGSLARHLA